MSPDRNAQMYDPVEDAYRVDPDAAAKARADGNGSGAASFKDVMRDVGELKEYATYLVSAKLDGIKVSLRNLALYAALGILGAVAGVAILATSAVLLLSGLSGMLGTLFGGRYNLSAFLVGLLVLGGILGGTWLMLGKITKASRQRTVEKYESRKHEQRANYGHDVAERSATAAK